MARKGYQKTAVLHMNIGLDQELAQAVDASSTQYERTLTQEVRFQLRKVYGLDQTPAEDDAGVSA